MTEYELAELLRSHTSDSLTFIPLLLSMTSGYLIVAWLVGAQLTFSQVSLVNTLFTFSFIVFAMAWYRRIEAAESFQAELLAINPERVVLVPTNLVPSAAIVSILIVAASVKFMWDIRHPKTE